METKRQLPPIQNETVRLRLLTEADLQLTLAWRNQSEIRRWFFHSVELTWDQHQGWFEKYAVRDDDFVFIIEDVQTDQPVGQVALYHIDWEARRCEYGRLMIGEGAARGKGYAKAATFLICQLGFDSLEMDEIYLEVLADNLRAQAVYTACGFQLDRRQDEIIQMSKRRSADHPFRPSSMHNDT